MFKRLTLLVLIFLALNAVLLAGGIGEPRFVGGTVTAISPRGETLYINLTDDRGGVYNFEILLTEFALLDINLNDDLEIAGTLRRNSPQLSRIRLIRKSGIILETAGPEPDRSPRASAIPEEAAEPASEDPAEGAITSAAPPGSDRRGDRYRGPDNGNRRDGEAPGRNK
jgi:hypothetical protein